MIDVPTQQPSSSPPATDTVAEVMRPALTTVEPDAHLAAAAYLMKHAGASALVILDDDHGNRPIGLITAQSMLAGRIRHLPVLHHGELVGMVDIGDLARPSLQLDGPSRTAHD